VQEDDTDMSEDVKKRRTSEENESVKGNTQGESVALIDISSDEDHASSAFGNVMNTEKSADELMQAADAVTDEKVAAAGGGVPADEEIIVTSVRKQAIVLEDSDDADNDVIFQPSSDTGKEDDEGVETFVREIVKHLVDQVTSGENDVPELHPSSSTAVDAAEGGCDAAVESVNLSAETGSDERCIESLLRIDSSPSIDEKKSVSTDDRCRELMELEHTGSAQERDESSVAVSECIMLEDVDKKGECTHEKVESESELCDKDGPSDSTNLLSADAVHQHAESVQHTSVQIESMEYASVDISSDEELPSVAADGRQEEGVVDISSDDDEDLPNSDAAAAAAVVSDTSTDLMDEEMPADVKLESDDLSQAADENDDVVCESTHLISADAVLKPQESSVIELLDQEEQQSSEACDVDRSSQSREAAEKIEARESLLPSTEVLDSSSNDSTVSYKSSEAENVSPTGGALSVEPEAESAELLSNLCSGDEPFVAPVDVCEQVSDVVVQEHGDAAEESLPSAAHDVTADDGEAVAGPDDAIAEDDEAIADDDEAIADDVVDAVADDADDAIAEDDEAVADDVGAIADDVIDAVADDDEAVAENDEAIADADDAIAEDDEAIADDDEAIADDVVDAVADDDDVITGDNEAVVAAADDDDAIADDDEAIVGTVDDDEAISDDDDAVADNDNAVAGADDDEAIADGGDAIAADDEAITGDNEAVVADDDDAIAGDDEAVADDGEAIADEDVDAVADDDEAIADDGEAVAGDDEAVAGDGEAVVADDDEAVADDGEAIADDDDVVADADEDEDDDDIEIDLL